MSEVFGIEGMAKWAKLRDPSDNYDKSGKEWSIDVYPTAEGMKQIKASGTAAQAKVGEDGTYFKFKRPVQKVTRSGKILNFAKPKAVLNDDTEFNGLIGNGSKVIVYVSTYPTPGGRPGTRLEGVKITELVEYNPEDSVIEPDLPF